MADKDPSLFADAGALTGAELLLLWQSGALKKLTLSDLLAAGVDITLGAASIGTLTLSLLPVYADDIAAGVGGLTEGEVYRTTTGELRIKLAA